MEERASAVDSQAITQEEIVALLASEGYSQSAIGSLLKLSQSTISRLLASSESRGYLIRDVRLNCPESRVRAIRAEVNRFEKWDDVKAKLKRLCTRKVLASIDVVPTVHEAHGDFDPWEASCFQFGRRSTWIVVDYLKRSHWIGVSYGRTLFSVVDGLKELGPHPIGQKSELRFFPTWTEPYEDANYKFKSKLFPNPADLSSTRLAKAFSRALSSGDDDVPSLNCFPSLLPLEEITDSVEDSVTKSTGGFSADEREVIRRFYRSNKSYNRVFAPITDPEPGLIHAMDTAIVGIGTTTPQGPNANPNWHVSKTVIESAGFGQKQHEQAFVGDIGGVWLPHPHARGATKKNSRTQDYIELIRDRWMGVTGDNLKACAERAKAEDRVGVIALAVGQDRSDAVIASIRASLVNRLIIDSGLAKKLDEVLSK